MCISLKISCVEAVTHNITVFGDRACKEVLKVKLSHKGGTLIQ